MGAHFTARYDGECAECGNTIVEGDPAGYVDDELCCQACWEEAEAEAEEWE